MNKNVCVDRAGDIISLYPAIVEYKMDSIQKDINYNTLPNKEVKELTINLLEASKPAIKKDTEFLKSIAKCVQRWEEDSFTTRLKEDILSFYSFQKDVCALYLCKNNQNMSFIVVMDDSTADTVFEYNEFGFELSEKYESVEDFMVIDEDEAEGCSGLFKDYNMIYKRG